MMNSAGHVVVVTTFTLGAEIIKKKESPWPELTHACTVLSNL